MKRKSVNHFDKRNDGAAATQSLQVRAHYLRRAREQGVAVVRGRECIHVRGVLVHQLGNMFEKNWRVRSNVSRQCQIFSKVRKVTEIWQAMQMFAKSLNTQLHIF